MRSTIRDHEWTREPTAPTREDDYAVDPLPPLPTPFVDKWEPQRTPWFRIFLMVVAVDALLHLVAGAIR